MKIAFATLLAPGVRFAYVRLGRFMIEPIGQRLAMVNDNSGNVVEPA